MPVKQMVCSGHVHRTLVPGWREIEAALDRWDDSIWLEAEGRQLSATRIDLVANDIADALGSAQAWLVVATDEVTDTCCASRIRITCRHRSPSHAGRPAIALDRSRGGLTLVDGGRRGR